MHSGESHSLLIDTVRERRPVGQAQASARGGVSGDSLGLSKSHNRPSVLTVVHKSLEIDNILKSDRNTIIYHPGAQLIKIKQPRGASEGNPSKRGNIQTFSAKSRRNLMNLMATLDRENLPLFVTLTYPKKYPDPVRSKRDLKVFIQRIKRLWPDVGYIWKLEFQKRGAPHFHLFMWGVDYESALGSISNIWFDVCKTGDPKHLLAGTNVERIRDPRGIMCYASKYLGKVIEEDLPEELGRLWGRGGKIPIIGGEEFKISDNDSYRLLRYLRRRILTKNKNIRTFYVAHPEQWYDMHDRLTGVAGRSGPERRPLPDLAKTA